MDLSKSSFIFLIRKNKTRIKNIKLFQNKNNKIINKKLIKKN